MAHIVPPTERGLEDRGSVDIQELLASLDDSQTISGGAVGDTFPILFPLGKGSPRQAEECVTDAEGHGTLDLEAEVAV